MPIRYLPAAAALLRRSAMPAALAVALSVGLPVSAALAQDASVESPAAVEIPAAEAVSPDAVIATVGGEEITEADLAFAAEELVQELQSIPPDDRRAFLVSVLIDMKVMANAARADGLDQTETFARRLSYLEDRALRRAFFAESVEGAVTDERLQATYDELIADFEPQPEIRARHILVETEDEAREIRAEIEGGTGFEEAAAEHSLDGSAQNGGDLGYFSTGMMVPQFEEAAFALEVGELSQPVQSQFGWHLIQLEDRRVSAPPPLEQLRGPLSQQVLYEVFTQIVADLKAATEIVIPDEGLAEAVEAQEGL